MMAMKDANAGAGMREQVPLVQMAEQPTTERPPRRRWPHRCAILILAAAALLSLSVALSVLRGAGGPVPRGLEPPRPESPSARISSVIGAQSQRPLAPPTQAPASGSRGWRNPADVAGMINGFQAVSTDVGDVIGCVGKMMDGAFGGGKDVGRLLKGIGGSCMSGMGMVAIALEGEMAPLALGVCGIVGVTGNAMTTFSADGGAPAPADPESVASQARHSIQDLGRKLSEERAKRRALNQSQSHFDVMERDFENAGKRFDQLDSGLSRIDERLGAGFNTIDSHLDRVDEHLNTIDSHLDHVDLGIWRIDQAMINVGATIVNATGMILRSAKDLHTQIQGIKEMLLTEQVEKVVRRTRLITQMYQNVILEISAQHGTGVSKALLLPPDMVSQLYTFESYFTGSAFEGLLNLQWRLRRPWSESLSTAALFIATRNYLGYFRTNFCILEMCSSSLQHRHLSEWHQDITTFTRLLTTWCPQPHRNITEQDLQSAPAGCIDQASKDRMEMHGEIRNVARNARMLIDQGNTLRGSLADLPPMLMVMSLGQSITGIVNNMPQSLLMMEVRSSQIAGEFRHLPRLARFVHFHPTESVPHDMEDPPPLRCDGGYPEGSIRLVDTGRLEICHGGEWGTVCDDGFGEDEARVVCRMLGKSGGRVISRPGGKGQIMLDEVDCKGSEARLTDCSHNSWGHNDCGHSEDVGVFCGHGDVRLRDGRVEVYHNGEWGTVCDDHFNDEEAQVFCRQVGLVGGYAHYIVDAGSGHILLDNVECDGSEARLTDCSHNRWGHNNCGHSEDVGVTCSDVYSHAPFSHVQWSPLPADMPHYPDVGGNLRDLPRGLLELRAPYSTTVQGFIVDLPRNLTMLSMVGPHWHGVSGHVRDLPPDLEHLELLGNFPHLEGDLAHLPRGLRVVKISTEQLTGQIRSLPQGLEVLVLPRGVHIEGDLLELPRTLHSLDLSHSHRVAGILRDLPPGLKHVRLSRSAGQVRETPCGLPAGLEDYDGPAPARGPDCGELIDKQSE